MGTRKLIKEYLKITIISIIVILFWQGLEILIIGEVRSSDIDTIIALILIPSLYGNLKWWESLKIK